MMLRPRTWDALPSGLDSKKITTSVPDDHTGCEFRRVFQRSPSANESVERATHRPLRNTVEFPGSERSRDDESGLLAHVSAFAASVRWAHTVPSPSPSPSPPARVPAPVVAHQVLVGTAMGESEARVRFSSGPLVGTEVQLRVEGERVSLAVLTEGAVSRQTLGQVLSEFTRRFDGKTRRFADEKPKRGAHTDDPGRER
jgi:hypothetical protein